MSLAKVSESRNGRLVLKVLKRRHSGERLLAVDVVRFDRVVFGVLLSWSEVQWLFDFVRGDVHLPELQGSLEEPVQLGLDSFSSALSQAEIGGAICEASRVDGGRNGRTVITVLPTLPKFRYLYTCPRCRCHAQSIFRVPCNEGEQLRLCPNCRHVYEVKKWTEEQP